MTKRPKNLILVTGSEGEIGRAVIAALVRRGYPVRRFDLKRDPKEDISRASVIPKALRGVSGVVHLARASESVGYHNPDRAGKVNARGTRNLISCMERVKPVPWLVFPCLSEPEDSRCRPSRLEALRAVREASVVPAAAPVFPVGSEPEEVAAGVEAAITALLESR